MAGVLSAVEPVQPVMMPQADLLQRLDPAQEWLLLPVGEWRRLTAAAAGTPTAAIRVGSGLVSGTVIVRCDSQGWSAAADLTASVDMAAAATVPLFGLAPERLDELRVNGAPGLVVSGNGPLAVVVPGSGRWEVGARWSQATQADATGWNAIIPLPLAAGLDVTIEAPKGWEVRGDGVVPDGDARWRLAGPQRALNLALRPTGSLAPAWGIEQDLTVQLPATGAGGAFAWSLVATAGTMPETLHLSLPQGFTALTSSGGIIQPDGSILIRSGGGSGQTVAGIVAAGSGLDLPTIDGARWQGGTINIAIATPARLLPPAGWIGKPGDASARHFAVTAPGRPLLPQPLLTAEGIDLKAAAAIAIGGGSVRATWQLEISSATPLHRLDLTLPAGWRVLAADAGTGAIDLPPADEVLAAPLVLAIPLPHPLPAGTTRAVVVALERPATASLAVVPPGIAGTVRSSHRVLLAAEAATEVSVVSAAGTAGWRLGPQASGGGSLEPVAELLATDAVPPLQLAIRPRPVRLEAEAACWLQPRGEDTFVRLDLRLVAGGGALDRIGLAVPAALDEGWRIEAGGATAAAEGDRLMLTWPAAWTGERLVRLAARLPASSGRTPAVHPGISVDGALVPLRLAIAALAGERVDVTAEPSGRAMEPDEMPAWSAPPPGTRILAAWRPLTGGDGAVMAHVPRLHDGPAGFLDQVVIRTQLAPGGGTTLLSARLAAPGLAALPLRLPPGMTLEQAVIDGQPAPVRQDGDGGISIILPGRTQVQLALRLAHAAAPGHLVLEPPQIDLPWLSTAWTVAVAPAWRAEPIAAAGAMPLRHYDALQQRHFLSAWKPGMAVHDGAVIDNDLPVDAATDPRLLTGAPVLAPAHPEGSPVLPLVGPRLVGERIGAPVGLQLQITTLDSLSRQDRLGRLLGVALAAVLTGLALARRVTAVRCIAFALAAGLGTAALLMAQVMAGPLLGACEAAVILIPFVAIIAWWRGRRSVSEAKP